MFQKYVNEELGMGVIGKISRNNPVTSVPRITEDDGFKLGAVAFLGTNPETQVVSKKEGAKSILGFVISTYNLGSSLNYSTEIRKGDEVQIILKGYLYASLANDSKYGDSVFVNPKTGELKAGTFADAVDTGFKVERGGKAGETIEIYKI